MAADYGSENVRTGDRLMLIRSDFVNGDLTQGDIEWLIAEVFRLRELTDDIHAEQDEEA